MIGKIDQMNWLNYHHLFYFWNVVRLKGFTRAAETLKISQSAISEQIRNLEVDLGMTLIERGRRRSLVVTEQGKVVFDFANQIFKLGSELKNWTMGNSPVQKTIRIGALIGLSRNFQLEFLKPILSRKDINFEILTGSYNQLIQFLEQYRLDLILTTNNRSSDSSDSLISSFLGKTPIVLVQSTSIEKKKKTLKSHLDGPLFIPSILSDLRSEIEDIFQTEHSSPTFLGEVDDIALLRLLALKGEGAAIIPKIGVLNEIKDRKLRIVFEFPRMFQSFYAIHRKESLPSRDVRDLISQFQTNLHDTKFFYH